MPLNLYPSIRASGSVPSWWVPARRAPRVFRVYNQKVLWELRIMLPGVWKKVIKSGRGGEVHYFRHSSGKVAGVKFYGKR